MESPNDWLLHLPDLFLLPRAGRTHLILPATANGERKKMGGNLEHRLDRASQSNRPALGALHYLACSLFPLSVWSVRLSSLGQIFARGRNF